MGDLSFIVVAKGITLLEVRAKQVN